MKNKLKDLNDYLFAQMERLSEEGIDDKKLDIELKRAKAISSVAKDIISNGRLVLDAQVKISSIPGQKKLPDMLE